MIEVDMTRLRDSIDEFFTDRKRPDIIYDSSYTELIGEAGFKSESLRVTRPNKKPAKEPGKKEEEISDPISSSKPNKPSLSTLRDQICNLSKQCDKSVEKCIELIDSFKIDDDINNVLKPLCIMMSDCNKIVSLLNTSSLYKNKMSAPSIVTVCITDNMKLYDVALNIANRCRKYIYYAHTQTCVFPDIVSAFYRLSRCISIIKNRRAELSKVMIDDNIISQLKTPDVRITRKIKKEDKTNGKE